MSDTDRVSARVRVKMLMRGLVGSTGGYPTHAEIDEALDAHECAVRAEERARLVGVITGLRKPHHRDCSTHFKSEPDYPFCNCGASDHNSPLTDCLAALTGADK